MEINITREDLLLIIKPVSYKDDTFLTSYLERLFPRRKVSDITKDLLKKKAITLKIIYEYICKERNTDNCELNDKSRKGELVQSRQISHYFGKVLTKCSDRYIGEEIGKKNRATVIHSIKKIKNILEADCIIDPNILKKDLIRYRQYFLDNYVCDIN